MNYQARAGMAVIGTLCITTLAHAADPAPAGHEWTGFYIGANAGAALNNSSVTNDLYVERTNTPFEGFRNTVDDGQTTFTAGVLLGYNYQIGKLVLGAEADFNSLGFNEDNVNQFNYLNLQQYPYRTEAAFEGNWFGTVRGRVGYAIENVMFYGTGGAAYGDMVGSAEYTNEWVAGTQSFKASEGEVNWGWTIGAGAEYGVDRWTLGIEYLYIDLGEAEWNEPAKDDTIKGQGDYAFSTVRATVKYGFH